MSRLSTLGNHLYTGEVSYDFVGRKRAWYALSGVLLTVAVASLVINGLTLGIEFRGGAEFRLAAAAATPETVREEVSSRVGGEVVVQSVGGNTVRVQTERLPSAEVQDVRDALAERFDLAPDEVSTQFIGPSWGEDISKKALRALAFFLFGLVIFLSLYFEWKMALAAILALVHDLVITIGIYSLVGFEVTPASVIGFLTILGYSLYDTVVVFDKVRENTVGLAGGSRMTYSEAANLALNQTLVRSINTSVIALLPIGAILFAGIVLLGAGPLKDLALALFVGVAAGTYSSIFIATPLLASMKEREPAMQALAKRVAARKAGGGQTTTVAARRAPARNARPTTTEGRGSTAVGVLEDAPESDAAGATTLPAAPARSSGAPARRSGASQRNQPRRGGGRNRSGGKKRR